MLFEEILLLLKTATNVEEINVHREAIAEWLPKVRCIFDYAKRMQHISMTCGCIVCIRWWGCREIWRMICCIWRLFCMTSGNLTVR